MNIESRIHTNVAQVDARPAVVVTVVVVASTVDDAPAFVE